MKPWEVADVKARILQADPEFVEEYGYHEVWQRGPLRLHVLALRDWYPEQLKAAVQLHRQAVLEGACPCGAVVELLETRRDVTGEHHHITGEWKLTHGPECPAHEEALGRLAAEVMPAADTDE